ncbi:ATPase [Amycolatopsis mediterranei S699]|uniref:ATPase n=3 Tax=Amycolatopsis mediterranei TaxID=33910 RepID=A0A0H3DHC4_AMYMU|nr:AAA family ATPase [Amycolatopsis mediterranei]ADJ50260.1 ATPase [Amycolatopsis mediterranei U32]AEK47260.1 ATPase [Amycolatopsis mediterranei S699]AFO81966.1 ATPase [Amycolatopsis mediterranei S699]AGT89095.1 ATPase [Amycolatopsis mediterranei RB]KDO08355.1 ATPase [Amycolatopsis mediterranei]
MSHPQITLTVRHTPSALDTRRGVVRLHPEVLDALGLRAWDAVHLTGARVSAALAAPADETGVPGVVLTDDVTMSNLGVTEGAEVVVAPADVAAAKTVTVAGSRLASVSVSPHMLRLALIGKVLTVGDAVSLLPQDLAPSPGSDPAGLRGQLSRAIGATWTNELLTVTATEPAGTVAVGPSTVVTWRDGARPGRAAEPAAPRTATALVRTSAVTAAEEWIDAEVVEDEAVAEEEPVVPLADLIGAEAAARKLAEWFDLAFQRPELLARLGAPAHLGVLLSGPEGVGKATLVRSVANEAGIRVIPLAAPNLAVLDPNVAVARLREAIHAAGGPSVLLLTDVDALLPATTPPPVATVVLEELRAALRRERFAVVATTARAESADPRLRAADLLDRELGLALPDAKTRRELLNVLLRDVPLDTGIDCGVLAERTPGFVAADLIALRRDAALRAALRQRDTDEPRISQQDLLDALATVRPVSMSTSDNLATGGLTLDDVGNMLDVKQSLTEAVLWPLRYPDSFARLGVEPPRGVLLYGPPGGGKTFLVRALAGTGALNVFAVKGAELMDKWVGESERAVRELFRRAAEAAPALIFLDEIDALAPRRGQSSDSGVADRVVAALLTELDGVEPMREVVVLGATNRPELVDPALLRPGRLERRVYVPPPDAEARAAILAASSKNTPLAGDVDLVAVASTLDGYSAADCAALIREAALTAMRESLEAREVTAAHLDAARKTVRPSLDPAQLATLEAYAKTQAGV